MAKLTTKKVITKKEPKLNSAVKTKVEKILEKEEVIVEPTVVEEEVKVGTPLDQIMAKVDKLLENPSRDNHKVITRPELMLILSTVLK